MSEGYTESETGAIEALKALGCREYEAKSFVALSKLTVGTAREVSEVTDIPRTRVYDAMEDLTEKGLVEVHYSTPKQYRTIGPSAAVEWFEDRYESELQQFRDSIRSLSAVPPDAREEATVWALSGRDATLIRANNTMRDADRRLVVYLDEAEPFNRELLALLASVDAQSVYVLCPPSLVEFVTDKVGDEVTVIDVSLPVTAIGDAASRTWPLTLVLADESAALMRTHAQTPDGEDGDQAIVANGCQNVLIVWIRMLFGL